MSSMLLPSTLPSTYSLRILAAFGENGPANPIAGVARDSSRGIIYGYTSTSAKTGNAAVFRILPGMKVADASRPFIVLNHAQGFDPSSDPILDRQGNLYGTTVGVASGQGRVFKIPAGSSTLVTLADLRSERGQRLVSNVVLDRAGNLYGVIADDGSYGGQGKIFRISAGRFGTSRLTTLLPLGTPKQSVTSATLTADPHDAHSTLYISAVHDGTVVTLYRFTPRKRENGALTPLASHPIRFIEGVGYEDCSGVTCDRHGNLFGTLTMGATEEGMVFELKAGSRKITPLVSFDGRNGEAPNGILVLDRDGNLYGTTESGGRDGENGHGTVYRIAAGTKKLTTVFSFTGETGFAPRAGVILDDQGCLYGTTMYGGPGECGTFFKLSPITPTLHRKGAARSG